MPSADIAAVRKLLDAPTARTNPWGLLAAAALAAASAMLMAGIVVLGPGIAFESPPAVSELQP
jgi:hypothetical protein